MKIIKKIARWIAEPFDCGDWSMGILFTLVRLLILAVIVLLTLWAYNRIGLPVQSKKGIAILKSYSPKQSNTIFYIGKGVIVPIHYDVPEKWEAQVLLSNNVDVWVDISKEQYDTLKKYDTLCVTYTKGRITGRPTNCSLCK